MDNRCNGLKITEAAALTAMVPAVRGIFPFLCLFQLADKKIFINARAEMTPGENLFSLSFTEIEIQIDMSVFCTIELTR